MEGFSLYRTNAMDGGQKKLSEGIRRSSKNVKPQSYSRFHFSTKEPEVKYQMTLSDIAHRYGLHVGIVHGGQTWVSLGFCFPRRGRHSAFDVKHF